MATIILQGLLHLENKVQKQSLGWYLFKRYKHVALDHKASHKDQIFFYWDVYIIWKLNT